VGEAPEEAALSVRHLCKSFGGTQALDDVSFSLRRGKIHALVGGNGSGKSTTIKVLAGVYQADRGEVELAGEWVPADSLTPARAREAGLRFVHQQESTFPDLTVAENLAIGHGFDVGAGGRVRWRSQNRLAERLLERFEIDASPRARLDTLSMASRAMVAIARAVQDVDDSRGAILVLDEPTSALPPHEVQLLLDALERYARAGQTIVYVSHRLDEIVRIADAATVLRDGRVAASIQRDEITHDRLVELIIGRKVDRMVARSARAMTDALPRVLKAANLAGGAVRDASFALHRGEIVGVAGLLGSGRSSLLRLLFGALPVESGEIELDGRAIRPSGPREAIRAGVAYVPEDRLNDAAFADLDVMENLGMATTSSYFRRGLLRHRAEAQDTRGLMTDFLVKAESPEARFSTLSGGNQQKVILARWLRRNPPVLLLDEPTQGVDVGARLEIWDLVRRVADQGTAVLAVCSDFDELATACDRILVMTKGRVVAEMLGGNLDGHGLEEAVLAEEREL
jgi:ribose transport system ATP-binding protein